MSPKYVCGACIRNRGIRSFIAEQGRRGRCGFCGRQGAKHPTAPFEAVVEFIYERLEQDFEDAAGVLPHDSGAGGYFGATYDAYDLVHDQLELDLAPAYEDTIRAQLIVGLPDDTWCERSPFQLNELEVLRYSWDEFRDVVRWKARYFFPWVGQAASGSPQNELLSPVTLLRRVFELAENTGVFTSVPAGLELHRARRVVAGQDYDSALDMGPPSAPKAVSANRMNPPGIPVLYAASTSEAAIAEAWDGPGRYAIARFRTTRAVRVLALDKAPEPADYFEMDREPLLQHRFLGRFRDSLAEPVARDKQVHTECIPTQVVAEYLRTMHRSLDRPVDGIMWPSAAAPGTAACALFATRGDLVLSDQLLAQLTPSEREDRGNAQGWLEFVGREFQTPRMALQASRTRTGRRLSGIHPTWRMSGSQPRR